MKLKYLYLYFFILLFCFVFAKNNNNKKPRVSIITSVYNGDKYIEEFLKDITRQTIFPESELILINANSPGQEESIIKKYLEKYKNIIYIKLNADPGIYGVWNMAIKKSRADFITNANLDDRRNPQALEIAVKKLETDNSIDLIYSNYFVTKYPNQTFDKHDLWFVAKPFQIGVNSKRIDQCGFGPQPVWRKNLHDKFGYFNEEFLIAGDWEFAIRILLAGAKFYKINIISGLYYNNPDGLSTANSTKREIRQNQEHKIILNKYLGIWNKKFGN